MRIYSTAYFSLDKSTFSIHNYTIYNRKGFFLMKKTVKLISLGAVTLAVTLCAVTAIKNRCLKTATYTLPEDFTVTAHTGCEGTADNSLDSIRSGAAAGADIVEIDLHFLPDGTPVLKHDEPKESEAGILPTLEEAFELLSTFDVKMNVDVKSTANIPAVAALAEKHGVTDKIFFTGVDENSVAAVKSGAPDIPYYLNVDINKRKNTDPDYISSVIAKITDSNAIGLNAKFSKCSKELIDAVKGKGLSVSLWTANKKSEMYRCLALEPDNITTRNPSELLSLEDR